MRNERVDVLILGGGAAGHSAAQAVRECGEDTSILMISQEEAILRPLLTKASLRQAGGVPLRMAEEAWYRDRRIEWRKETVKGIFPERHCAETETARIFYHKCIYALGSEPFLPSFPGNGLDGVFTLRSADDIAAVKRRLLCTKDAVVIGGGVVGVEAGELLAEYGVGVTILESQRWMMPRVLDRATAEEYRRRLGIRVEIGVTIERLTGDRSVTGAALADGRTIPCQMVIISCGVRANTELALSAGLDVRRGVVVSERMETSAPGVYACGDCTEYQGECPALWRTAREQGRVAGLNACGRNGSYKAVPSPILFYSKGAPLFALGDLSEGKGRRIETARTSLERPFLVAPRQGEAYSRMVYSGERLIGAALVGDLSAMSELQQQITGEAE